MIDIHELEAPSIESTDKILTLIKIYGICIIRQYIADEDLYRTQDEFNLLLNINNTDTVNHPINKNGLVRTLSRNYISNSNNNYINKYFLSEKLKIIADEYFPYGHNFNNSIFLTYEKEDEIPILPWHHDRIQALKFYLNLKDVTADDGAFEYVPGSHKYGYYRANYYIATGCPIDEIPNDIPDDEILYPITVEVNAGDLIIFDADGIHRGGIVKPGHERKVIRAHTNPLPYLGYSKPRLFTKMWWIQSIFNPARIFKNTTGRVLREKFKPGASKGKYRNY